MRAAFFWPGELADQASGPGSDLQLSLVPACICTVSGLTSRSTIACCVTVPCGFVEQSRAPQAHGFWGRRDCWQRICNMASGYCRSRLLGHLCLMTDRPLTSSRAHAHEGDQTGGFAPAKGIVRFRRRCGYWDSKKQLFSQPHLHREMAAEWCGGRGETLFENEQQGQSNKQPNPGLAGPVSRQPHLQFAAIPDLASRS